MSSCLSESVIVRTSEYTTEVIPILLLRDLERPVSGFDIMHWDGRDDARDIVARGLYTMRGEAKYHDGGTEAYATGWVWVLG